MNGRVGIKSALFTLLAPWSLLLLLQSTTWNFTHVRMHYIKLVLSVAFLKGKQKMHKGNPQRHSLHKRGTDIKILFHHNGGLYFQRSYQIAEKLSPSLKF